MRASELQSGKTYVGKNGKRRRIVERARIPPDVMQSWDTITYERPEGGFFECSAKCFATWAEREATPDEAAP